ncbi:surface glycoprotein [Halanaeroarchaeum sp. HSR-CO]|nr:surface glycoprotein [Halanaeroarchaeum sp. HSR-CO]
MKPSALRESNMDRQQLIAIFLTVIMAGSVFAYAASFF